MVEVLIIGFPRQNDLRIDPQLLRSLLRRESCSLSCPDERGRRDQCLRPGRHNLNLPSESSGGGLNTTLNDPLTLPEAQVTGPRPKLNSGVS
jgi:hypothetical protein